MGDVPAPWVSGRCPPPSAGASFLPQKFHQQKGVPTSTTADGDPPLGDTDRRSEAHASTLVRPTDPPVGKSLVALAHLVGVPLAPTDARRADETRLCRLANAQDLPGLQQVLTTADLPLLVVLDVALPWRRPATDRYHGARRLLLQVRAVARQHGLDVRAEHMLWPSACDPRVAVPVDARDAFAWLLRSGVIGGGRTAAGRLVTKRGSVKRLLMWGSPGACLVVFRP